MSCSSSSDSASPSNRSFPFTISAILSDEVGQKKSPPYSCLNPSSSSSVGRVTTYSSAGQDSYTNSDTPKRPRKYSSSTLARTPKMPLSEVVSSSYQNSMNKPREGLHGGQHMAYYTPYKSLSSSQVNTSHISPFNTNVLLALGQQPSPGQDEQVELFSDTSLGMLSEVAQYHSELSGMEPSSASDTTMQEKFAKIRLLSLSGDDGIHETSSGDAWNSSFGGRVGRKILTPSILKRDRRRRASSGECSGTGEDATPSNQDQAQLSNGFLSPLGSEKSSHKKELGFSPSIFLSRPDHTTMNSSSDTNPIIPPSASPHSSSTPIPIPATDSGSTVDTHCRKSIDRARLCGSSSPCEQQDCDQLNSSTGGQSGDGFVTSTPIKVDKENVRTRSGSGEDMEGSEDGRWSPNILRRGARKHLRETNESSSDCEAVKKPRLPTSTRQQPRKSKARTKLSPLLENSYSPIFKDTAHLPNPSPLTTALMTTPTRSMPLSMFSLPSTTSLSHSSPHATAQFIAPPSISAPQTHSSMTIQHPLRPTNLLGTNMLTTTIGGPSLIGAHPLTVGGTATSTQHLALQYRAFPTAVAASPFLNTSQQQQQHLQISSTAHTPQTPLLSISQLQSPALPFPHLAGTPLLQGYATTRTIRNTSGVMPGYVPFVNLVTAPAPVMATPSYLSYDPYSHSMTTLDRGLEGKVITSSTEKPLQSVPPWFIFSNNRSEKRSRLTEAINKSLSETPSQPSKLPVEWTKFACGQTKDQKTMTEKARMFMQFRPRQLTFSSDTD